jgi:hypothetical protein
MITKRFIFPLTEQGLSAKQYEEGVETSVDTIF